MTDTKNTVSDERLAVFLQHAMKPDEIAGPKSAERVGELLGWFKRYLEGHANPKWLVAHAAELAYALQSLRASIPGGVGAKALGALLDEFASDIEGLAMLEYMAGSAPSRDQVEQAKSDIANTRQRILSALDLSPTDTQCCMCGKTGLSTIEGDGGTECQLEDGRWTCSGPCWEKAGGYGPDFSPAEGEPVAWQSRARQRMEDYETEWSEWRDGKAPQPIPLYWEVEERPLYASPSNPVISDEMVERGAIALAGYDWETCVNDRPRWRDEAREVLTATLSVNPQSGSEKP